MSKQSTSVAILGAGISGLSIAYALQKRGVDVTVYEKESAVGGVIKTHHKDGWLVEEGPNTMLVRDQKIWEFLDDLQLFDKIIKPGSEAKKRYIVRDEKLCAAPMSFVDFLKSDLLSASAKMKLLKEPFVSAPEKDDEDIASFIRRRLGNEPLDYAVNPFVSGIYAGDVNKLSIKHTFSSLFDAEQQHGSITKGFLKRDKKTGKAKRALISFDDGLQCLPKALQKKLGNAVHLNTNIGQIYQDKKSWSIQFKNGHEEPHHAIISTIPAHQIPDIWNDATSNDSIKQLAEIDYAPMSVLALGFKRDQIAHPLDGFGMLIPEKEPFNLLGCLFSSSLFANRAPKDHVLLTCFLGGARHRNLAATSTQELVSETLPQLRDLLGLKGEPVFTHHIYWPQAIPQFNVGYDAFLQSIDQLEKENPGFFMAGNFTNGVSVPDCILDGFDKGDRLAEYL